MQQDANAFDAASLGRQPPRAGGERGSAGAAASTRVVLIGEGDLLLEGLACVIDDTPACVVVGRFASLDPAAARLDDLNATVVVLDTSRLGVRAPDVVGDFKHGAPRIPLLALIESGREGLTSRLVLAGADGASPHDLSRAELLAAIKALAAGHTWMHPRLQGHVLEEIRGGAARVQVSARERDVLGLAANGMSNKEIARALDLTEGTVKSYVRRTLSRLVARDRTHAVTIALRLGLIELGPRLRPGLVPQP